MFLIMYFTYIILTSSVHINAFDKKLSRRQSLNIFENSWRSSNIKAPFIRHELFNKPSVGSIYGLSSTKQFKDNEQVLFVPIESCPKTLEEGESQDDIPSGFESIWKEIQGLNRLSIILCLEYLKCQENDNIDNSPYYNYIKFALPDQDDTDNNIDTPFHWNENDLKLFPYRSIIDKVVLQKKQWSLFYDKVSKIDGRITQDRLYWAMECVRSRAFRGIGASSTNKSLILPLSLSIVLLISSFISFKYIHMQQEVPLALATVAALLPISSINKASKQYTVLLPAIDSCNHSSSNYNCELDLDPSRGGFSVRAAMNNNNKKYDNDNRKDGIIGEKEEITISYGERHNDDLLQYFGFVEKNNQYDIYRGIINGNGGSSSSGSSSSSYEINCKDRTTWVVPPEVDERMLKTALKGEEIKLQSWIDSSSSSSNSSSSSSLLQIAFVEEKLRVLRVALSLM